MNIIFKESKNNYRTGTQTTWEIFHSLLIFWGITIIIIILLFKLFITTEIKEKPNFDENSNNIVEIETVNNEQLSINHELYNSLDNSTYIATKESNNQSPQKLKIKLKQEEKIRKKLIKKQEKEVKKAEKNLKKIQRKAEKDRKKLKKDLKKVYNSSIKYCRMQSFSALGEINDCIEENIRKESEELYQEYIKIYNLCYSNDDLSMADKSNCVHQKCNSY